MFCSSTAVLAICRFGLPFNGGGVMNDRLLVQFPRYIVVPRERAAFSSLGSIHHTFFALFEDHYSRTPPPPPLIGSSVGGSRFLCLSRRPDLSHRNTLIRRGLDVQCNEGSLHNVVWGRLLNQKSHKCQTEFNIHMIHVFEPDFGRV